MSGTHPSRSTVLVFGWTMAFLPMVALFLFLLYILGTVIVATIWYTPPIVLVTQTIEGQLLERRVLKAKRTSGELDPWGRQEQWDAEGKLVKSVPFFLSSNRLHGRIFDRLIQPDRAMLTPGSPVFSGHVIELQPNGVLARTTNFRDGKRHGEEITRHPDGRIATKGNYVAGNRDGLWQEWDQAGVLRRSAEMLNDVLHGSEVIWDEHGHIMTRAYFIHGVKDGSWEKWREDGRLACHGIYVRGVATGIWEYWYNTGVYYKAVTLLSGIPEGLETVWFRSGNIASRGSYTNGQRTGRWEIWYPSGVLQRTVELANDSTRNGEETIWYENGQIASRGSYSKGEKNGQWDHWTEEGLHIRHEQWKDGKPNGEWLILQDHGSGIHYLFRREYRNGRQTKEGEFVGEYAWDIDEYLQKKAEEEKEKEETKKLLITLFVCVPLGLILLGIIGSLLSGGSSPPYPVVSSPPSSSRDTSSEPRKVFGQENWAAFSRHRDATPDNVNLLSVSKAICDGQRPPGSLISSGREIRPWDPRVDAPTARMIPDTPSAYLTPDGTILNNSGSILGSVDLVTGDVRLSNGRLLNDNVKGITDPSEAAARAYTIIDNDGC